MTSSTKAHRATINNDYLVEYFYYCIDDWSEVTDDVIFDDEIKDLVASRSNEYIINGRHSRVVILKCGAIRSTLTELAAKFAAEDKKSFDIPIEILEALKAQNRMKLGDFLPGYKLQKGKAVNNAETVAKQQVKRQKQPTKTDVAHLVSEVVGHYNRTQYLLLGIKCVYEDYQQAVELCKRIIPDFDSINFKTTDQDKIARFRLLWNDPTLVQTKANSDNVDNDKK